MIIRPENQGDYTSIEKILRLCFPIGEDKARDYKNKEFNEWVLVNEIRACTAYIPELSLVAVEDNQVVGYIMFSKCTIGNQSSIALAPLAVHPDYQRKGIGGALIMNGLASARSLCFKSSIVLGGKYYTKFGYRSISNNIYLADGLNEYLYIIELQEGSLETLAGQVRYCKPFYDGQGNLL